MTTLSLLLLSLILISIGLFQGQAGDVMMKAITICLECIGLG